MSCYSITNPDTRVPLVEYIWPVRVQVVAILVTEPAFEGHRKAWHLRIRLTHARLASINSRPIFNQVRIRIHTRAKFCLFSPLVFASSQSTTSNGNYNSWNPHSGSHPRFHTFGWLEYYLSDVAVYYVHPTTRVTTDTINLRSERMLTGVERFLEVLVVRWKVRRLLVARCGWETLEQRRAGWYCRGGGLTIKSGLLCLVMNMNMVGRDPERARKRKEVQPMLREIVSYNSCCLLVWGFIHCVRCFQNLILNIGIGRSWKHTRHIILFLQKPR